MAVKSGVRREGHSCEKILFMAIFWLFFNKYVPKGRGGGRALAYGTGASPSLIYTSLILPDWMASLTSTARNNICYYYRFRYTYIYSYNAYKYALISYSIVFHISTSKQSRSNLSAPLSGISTTIMAGTTSREAGTSRHHGSPIEAPWNPRVHQGEIFYQGV